jgi:hypothetical protein
MGWRIQENEVSLLKGTKGNVDLGVLILIWRSRQPRPPKFVL